MQLANGLMVLGYVWFMGSIALMAYAMIVYPFQKKA
jgi:hypothetical protein